MISKYIFISILSPEGFSPYIKQMLCPQTVYCDLSLNMEDSVTGVRSHSVKIPCTYTPAKDYEEHNVEWSLHSEVIIHRTDSQDQSPLVKFRDRVEMSQTPGDVSLTIRQLGFGDKGNIKCKVTWKKNDGTLISKEEITILKILRGKLCLLHSIFLLISTK